MPSALKTSKDSGKDPSIASSIGSLLPILKQPFSLAQLTRPSNYIVAFRDHQLSTYEWSVPNRTIDYSSVHTHKYDTALITEDLECLKSQ